MSSTEPVHATETMHAAESPHTTEATHTPAGEWTAMKTRSRWGPETGVIELMKMIEVVKAMKVIDKDQAHAPADENRRPPPPEVGIGIGPDRIPQHAAIRALHDLPGPVSLQARPTDDLLHRAIDFCLSGNRTAIRAAVRYG
jgi:hypothetical protein